MVRKGLLEWKILAAIFAVLIVSSSALVGNAGIKDMFFNSTEDIGETTGDSPLQWLSDWFSSLFTTPKKESNFVVIKLSPKNLTLDIKNPVNISAGSSDIDNFKGSMNFNFVDNTTELILEGSDFRLSFDMKETVIDDIKIPFLIFNNIDFIVTSENTNITATDDRIEIYDFFGKVTVTDSVELAGNVTKAKNGQWSIG